MRTLPVSEMGYLSHFVPLREVEAAKSPQDFAHEEALALPQSKLTQRADLRQLALFG